MKIWKDNEIQRSSQNVKYAYENYFSDPTHKNWSLFWEAFKTFLKETEYYDGKYFQKNTESEYIPYTNNQSILELLRNII